MKKSSSDINTSLFNKKKHQLKPISVINKKIITKSPPQITVKKKTKAQEKEEIKVAEIPVLGITEIRWCDYYLLIKSISEHLDDKVNKFENFNPYFPMLAKNEEDLSHNKYYHFNNKRQLICQVSESEGLVLGKITDIYIKKISFIGEDFDKLYLFENECTGFNYASKTLSMIKYDLNSGPNIEIFISYLVSLLAENKLCPSFNYYYFSGYAIMKRYTYEITNDCLSYKTMKVIRNMINKCTASYEVFYNEEDSASDCNGNDVTEDANDDVTEDVNIVSSESDQDMSYEQIIEDDILLTLKNHPCYILITEKNDLNFSEVILAKKAGLIKSVIFQVFAAVAISYHYFSIKNNDLHTGNIMLKTTKKTTLGYTLNGIFYLVPSYGYKAKIIDWGRGTFMLHCHDGNNLIYNDKLYQGFYNYSQCYNKSKKNLPSENKYSDIVIFCHSILNDFFNNSIDKTPEIEAISTFLRSFSKDLDITEYSWTTYEDIMKMPGKTTFSDMFISHGFFAEYISMKKYNNTVYNIIE